MHILDIKYAWKNLWMHTFDEDIEKRPIFELLKQP